MAYLGGHPYSLPSWGGKWGAPEGGEGGAGSYSASLPAGSSQAFSVSCLEVMAPLNFLSLLPLDQSPISPDLAWLVGCSITP